MDKLFTARSINMVYTICNQKHATKSSTDCFSTETKQTHRWIMEVNKQFNRLITALNNNQQFQQTQLTDSTVTIDKAKFNVPPNTL